ncbi:peptide chain release factor N(5)-glutamine methyltransferase [Paracoccus beibuensis]|uniref:peptide chain release factor N(5)-glutamine methyltransferase n=1 Tax=Paracoccus beibuensis TaxID=547602 RepID=UPI00223FCFBB|nr:peptide chain release factor N(5)-glutamine methyltransferase [Paracoccus beibuensis]
MNLLQAQAEGAALLKAAGIEAASRDADRILAAVLEIEPGQLRITDDRALTSDEAARFHRGIAARALRQPVAQIVGFRDFWAHRFKVTCDTLDPRPETESLVEAALARPWQTVLDLGTGSGAILISLLAARAGTTGTGTDLSEAALQVARFNARRIGVNARFRQADWYQGISGSFDLIVSNPPYIAASEMAGLASDVRDWEPRGALTDGGDGLSAYRAIAAGARGVLSPGGAVLVEIGSTQADDVAAIFRASGARTRVLPDLDGRDRVVTADFA